MYYLGNVRYFLNKKGFAPEKIEKLMLLFENDGLIKGDGDDHSLIAGAAPVRILDHELGKEFVEDFNKDEIHLQICMNKGQVPV